MRGVHYHALRRTWTIHVDYTWLVFLVEDCAGEFTHHNSQGTREATRRGAVEGKGKGGRCIEPQPPSTQNDSNPTAGPSVTLVLAQWPVCKPPLGAFRLRTRLHEGHCEITGVA